MATEFGVYLPAGYGTHMFKWQCDDNGIQAACTFAFRNAGNQTAEECAEAINAIFVASGRPAAANATSDQWRFKGSYTLIQLPLYQLSWDVDVSVVGTVMAASPSAANSLVVNKRTAYAGRRYRGRFGWPPFILPESQVDAGGNIDSGVVSQLQDDFDDCLDDLTAAVLPMCIAHVRKTIDEEPTPTIVTSLTVSPLMGVQRKRSGR